MHMVFCETNPNDARNDEFIENDDADKPGTKRNTTKMVSTQNQENPQGDNRNSSSEKLDSPLEESNNYEPTSITHSRAPRKSRSREWKSSSSFPHELIIRDVSQGIRTRLPFK